MKEGKVSEDNIIGSATENFPENGDNVNVVPCTCGCGCGNTAEAPKFSVFAQLSKCPSCQENHTGVSLTSPTKVPEFNTKASTRVHKKYETSYEDIQRAKTARVEVAQDLWRNAWKVWVSRIPQKFQEASTSNPSNSLVIEKINQLEAHKTSLDTAGLLIRGKVGRGKTWLAVGYANDLIKKGLLYPTQVLFGSESKLLASAANATFKDVEKELKELTSGKYKMIIIDDIGRGTWLREDMRPKVFSLVFDQQWADGNTVVATTNLSRKELSDYIGSAAMDRLLSMCGYAPDIIMEGADQRKEQTNQRVRNVRHTRRT